MSGRTVYTYPGSPVPKRSDVKPVVLGLAACIALGAVIGWYWGGRVALPAEDGGER